MSKRNTITRMQNILAAVKAVPEISATMKADLSQLLAELADRRRQATLNKDAFTSRYAAEEEWREHARYLDSTLGFLVKNKRYASIVDWLYSEREEDEYESARTEELFRGVLTNAMRENYELRDSRFAIGDAYNTLVDVIRNAKEESKECNVCSPNGSKSLYDFLNELLEAANHLHLQHEAERHAIAESDTQETKDEPEAKN